LNPFELLHQKYLENTLAHFYLLEPQFQDPESQILDGLQSFINSIGVNDPINHPDCLWILDAEKKMYVKEEIQPLYQFIKHPALELKRKFLLIHNVHKLTEITVNKLLKEFEEPPIELTIFVTNPFKNDVLATLRSRSNLLRIPLSFSEPKQLSTELKNLSLEDFSKHHVADRDALRSFLNRLTSHFRLNINDIASFDALQKLTDAISIDIDYNNPLQQSQFRIYSFIQKHL